MSITAIGEDGRPLQDNALIWVKDKTPADLSMIFQKLSAHSGWIRGRKGVAIRVPLSQRQEAWKIIRPGETLQQAIPSNFKYTFFPVPEGVTAEGLRCVRRHLGAVCQWEGSVARTMRGPSVALFLLARRAFKKRRKCKDFVSFGSTIQAGVANLPNGLVEP